MKAISIDKLNSILEEQSSSCSEQMNFSDTFAVACFLHAEGHRRAGRKLLCELFDLLGWHRRQAYFRALLNSLSGNEEHYALSVLAHEEVRSLFRSPGPYVTTDS